MEIVLSKFSLRSRITLLCALSNPKYGLQMICRYVSVAALVDAASVKLCGSVSLFCCALIPIQCLEDVHVNAQSTKVGMSEQLLRIRKTLISSLLKPSHSRRLIDWGPPPAPIGAAKLKLCGCVTLIGGTGIPFHSFNEEISASSVTFNE